MTKKQPTLKYADYCAFSEVARYAEADTEHAHQVAVFMWAARANAELAKLNGELPPKPPEWAWTADDSLSMVRLVWRPEAIEALRLLFAIPNGGERAAPVAARMKAEGAKAGVSDLMLPVARVVRSGTIGNWPYGLHHGLFLEMKRPEVREHKNETMLGKMRVKQRAGAMSEDQKAWFDAMERQEYATAVAWTFHEALAKLWSYLH